MSHLIGLPIFWAFVDFSLGRVERISYKIIFLASVAAHYIGIVALLHTETFGDWEYCQRTWSVEARTIAGGFATYAIGQIAMLILFATRAQIEAGAV